MAARRYSVASISQLFIYITTLFLIFLFPLFFLPITANFFEPNKLMLLLVGTGLNTLAWAVYVIASKELKLTITPFTIPLLLVGLVVILSGTIASNNYTEAFMGRGALIPALVVLVFVVVNAINTKKFIHHALYALIASATVLSLISIFQSLGFGPSMLLNRFLTTTIPDTLAFTPAGSPLALVTFLAAALITTMFLAFTTKESLEKIALFLLSAVMASGLVLVSVFSFPGKDTAPVFLPIEHGYVIALEALKDTKTALLGYGPESFVVAYNRTRPATMNLTPFWNIRFTNSSNELFHTVTTTGVLGLIAWIFLIAAIFKLIRKDFNAKHQSVAEEKVVKLVAISLLFLFLLIPATYVHYFVFTVIIMLWSLYLKFNHPHRVRNINLSLHSVSLVRPDESGERESQIAVLPYVIGIPLAAIVIAVLYFSFDVYAAEMSFKRALDAAIKNEGVNTYNLQRDAIVRNPYVTQYRRGYSATNLALANSIAGKEELTDQDRQNITQLIQQSIREAKAAVTLEPQDASNWENLTVVYRSLIGVAQNADAWTLASLAQAIQNDPINPRLRLELGGVYYALGQYDQAIRLYQQSAELKPDWANAYYNLSAAHREKGELDVAFDYMRQVVVLVEVDTADYARAQEELQTLADLLNVPTTEAESIPPQGELNIPSPAPTTIPGGEVELPEGTGPDNIEEEVQPPSGPTPTPIPTTQP